MSAVAGTERSRWAALYALCAGFLMIILDVTIVNVALPSIQRDLGFSQHNLAWVVNAYLIAFGGLLLLSGRLGDLIGQRRVFLTGLVIFTAASLLCAISPNQVWLIAARFVQGVGGALTSAVILGMIVTMFPEPKEQAKAIGVYGFVASAGGSIGLLAGGALTSINWHWIFLINLPIGVVTAYFAVRLVEDRKGPGFKKGADIPGAALLTAGLMTAVYAILQIEKWGWDSVGVLTLAGVAVALIVAFVVRQTKVANPLMPLRLFRSRTLTGANLIQALLVAGMFGMFFLAALYVQQILGYSSLEVGLTFLPVTVVMGAMSLRFAVPVTTRFGVRTTLVVSFLLVAAGLLLFARTPVNGHYLTDLLAPSILLGLGAGLGMPGLMTLAMAGVAPEDSGLASGLVNTSAQVGGAIGLAVLATAAAGRADGQLVAGVDPASALNSGFHLAYLIGAAMVVAATLIVLVVVRKPAEAVEEAPAEEPESEYAEAA